MTRTVVVVSGGTSPGPLPDGLTPGDPAVVVVAADRGVDHALSLGIVPHVAVGDFDSVSAAGLERVMAAGTEVRRHPRDKDATDLELALDVAETLVTEGPVGEGADDPDARIVVLGDPAGRLDHLLASVAVLTRRRSATVTAHLGGHRVDVVHPGRAVTLGGGGAGKLVTLLAHGGVATGVTTTGLRFALRDAVLEPWSSLGVSNECSGAAPASVRITSGVVLAITPGAVAERESQEPEKEGT